MGEFGAGGEEEGESGVGGVPELEEGFVGGAGLRRGRERERAGELKLGESEERISNDDSGMRKNFLEFGGGFVALVKSEVDLATDEGGIECAEGNGDGATGRGEFVERSGFESRESARRIVLVEGDLSVERGEIEKTDGRIVGILMGEFFGGCLRSRVIADQSKSERGAIAHFPAVAERDGGGGVAARFDG